MGMKSLNPYTIKKTQRWENKVFVLIGHAHVVASTGGTVVSLFTEEDCLPVATKNPD